MLGYVPVLDAAAATYGDGGRVERVLQSRRPVAGAEDTAAVLPWLRARNSSCSDGANIWIRPGSNLESHPLVMLDDLPAARAVAVCRKYAGAVVETSSSGNSQVWIVLNRPLGREQRQLVASALCNLIGSDPGAISEPRWGRLPGFQQRKPGKTGWTNLRAVSCGQTLDPAPYLAETQQPPGRLPPNGVGGALHVSAPPGDGDQHRREFAFACHSLRAGQSPGVVAAAIAERALRRGKRATAAQANAYGERTVRAAMARLN